MLMTLMNPGRGTSLISCLQTQTWWSWRNPMEELCAELAPGNSSAAQSYLVFERGECVHAVKKDIWNPAADAQRLREFLTGRRKSTRR